MQRLARAKKSKAQKRANAAPRPATRRRRTRKPLAPAAIIERLADEAPLPPQRPHGDAMSELVLTLLSQNTSDTNSGRAYQSLLARFPEWETVLAASPEAIEATIRVGGLANTKSQRLQALLAKLCERLGPDWDTSPLERMPIAEAKAWLTSLPGIGPKTAACVLLFALGRPALPVDTHVHRVAQRLGLIGPKVNAIAAHQALEAQMRPSQYYAFHVSLIRHGRRVCKAQRPQCGECVLADRCPSSSLTDSGRRGDRSE